MIGTFIHWEEKLAIWQTVNTKETNSTKHDLGQSDGNLICETIHVPVSHGPGLDNWTQKCSHSLISCEEGPSWTSSLFLLKLKQKKKKVLKRRSIVWKKKKYLEPIIVKN